MGGPTSSTLEAEALSAAQRVHLSEMDQHLETMKWLLDCLTPESVDLCFLAIASCTKSAGILKGVVSLIHNRAVLEPTICPLYAKPCSNLHEKLPTFPPEEPDGKEIEFKPLLLKKCQEMFDGNDELWNNEREVKLSNIQLIGELLKQNMLSEEGVHSVIERLLLGTGKEVRPIVQNVEAISKLLSSIGKQLDESPVSRLKLDAYMNRLNKLAVDALGVYLKVQSVALLRTNNWEEPNTQMVVAKIHSDSQESGSESEENRIVDTNIQDVVLKRKTVCLLEEYFSKIDVGKAMHCVEELDSPWYHSQVVKEAIFLGLDKSPACTDQVIWLLEYLFSKNAIIANDVADGCVSYGSLMDVNPRAHHGFGEIMGELVLAGGLDFAAVRKVLKKMEYEYFRKAVFNATLRMVNLSLSPAAQAVLDAQASEINACRLCCGLL